jgi:hypothetical protein
MASGASDLVEATEDVTSGVTYLHISATSNFAARTKNSMTRGKEKAIGKGNPKARAPLASISTENSYSLNRENLAKLDKLSF